MPYEIFAGENLLIKFALMSMADGLTWIGDWNSGTAYVVDNVVVNDQIAYKCTLGHTNHEPPNGTYWEVLPSIAASEIKYVLMELVQDTTGQTPFTTSRRRAFVTWTYDGTADRITSGLLTTGSQYLIVSYGPGDDFTNVGAASNAAGIFFTATDTTPDDWTNGSTLQPVEYLPNVLLADGLLTMELLADDTRFLSGVHEIRLSIAVEDVDYIESGGQTDVLALTEILTITRI